MKSIIHVFLLAVGAILVGLRLYPSHHEGLISRLFFDDVIHAKIEAVSIRVIGALGLPFNEASQFLSSNLTSLGHAIAIMFQALVIALTFYIVTRRI